MSINGTINSSTRSVSIERRTLILGCMFVLFLLNVVVVIVLWLPKKAHYVDPSYTAPLIEQQRAIVNWSGVEYLYTTIYSEIQTQCLI